MIEVIRRPMLEKSNVCLGRSRDRIGVGLSQGCGWSACGSILKGYSATGTTPQSEPAAYGQNGLAGHVFFPPKDNQ